jgi:hypothetical protein
MSPRWGSTPRLTDGLTISRNVTLTLIFFQFLSAAPFKRVLGRRQPWEVQFSVQQSAAEFQSELEPEYRRIQEVGL